MKLAARFAILLGTFGLALPAFADEPDFIEETVYVESPTDTDSNKELDRIYVRVTRPRGETNLPVMYYITPYAFGGNDVPFHNVDVDLLPQDVEAFPVGEKASFRNKLTDKGMASAEAAALERGYATVSAHSVGTGYSNGCPTVGDEAETLAAKAVIDWLNGRARGFNSDNEEVMATWSSGDVGMTGVSYNGTLPNMVATTGVEGLRAIVPVAAISNWYNYYRSNGLVVGPGGYIGEDADILGKFIVRRGRCTGEIAALTRDQGREHGDFDEFWQARDYVSQAENVTAAVFIVHGQSDWNVRQRHAIEWWHALEGVAPRRMWLHRGGHGGSDRSDYSQAVWDWFDHYVKGEDNGVENEPAVEVEMPDRAWVTQDAWPAETTTLRRLYFNDGAELGGSAGENVEAGFSDMGRRTRLGSMVNDPTRERTDRLAFVTTPLTSSVTLSGTPRVTMDFVVNNRSAANLTVALVDYDRRGQGRIVTRGWMDPQNHSDTTRGGPLVQGESYTLTFDIEPKQYVFERGRRIGVVVTSTDYEHTLRPNTGTEVEIGLGPNSFIDLHLSE